MLPLSELRLENTSSRFRTGLSEFTAAGPSSTDPRVLVLAWGLLRTAEAADIAIERRMRAGLVDRVVLERERLEKV